MGIKYRSPAKLSRSLLRSLEYKKAKLEDIWDADISINNENFDLIWNVSKCLKITLKKNVQILDAWQSGFESLPLSVKLTKFQNMWKPDANCFTLFSSVHHHLRRNTSQCDNFCSEFTSPYCGNLTYFLATNSWPD